MSGKSPRRETPSPAQGTTRSLPRSRSARSDRSESPGQFEWKNNAERCKTGAKAAGRDLVKATSESARSTGGQTPRSSQRTPRSGAKTPRTPRSRTPRSSTPSSGKSDDGTGARLPLYMQPTQTSINKSRKPPVKSATFHSRGSSGEETGSRRGAGARQDSRAPVTVKSWTSGSTPKRVQPKRPNSASSEPAIVGEGIIPKGHVGGRASPLEMNSNGMISTPPPSPSAASSQDRPMDEPLKKTSPVKKKPAPLVLSDKSTEEANTVVQESPKKTPLAKKSPPTPTGAKTPPARTPAAASPTKSPPVASPAASSTETPDLAPLAPEVNTSAKSLTAAAPPKSPKAVSSQKKVKVKRSKSPSAKSPKAVLKSQAKVEDVEVSIQDSVPAPKPSPPPPVHEVTPPEGEIVVAPLEASVREERNKKPEPEAEKGDGMVTKVKKLFGCMRPTVAS